MGVLAKGPWDSTAHYSLRGAPFVHLTLYSENLEERPMRTRISTNLSYFFFFFHFQAKEGECGPQTLGWTFEFGQVQALSRGTVNHGLWL